MQGKQKSLDLDQTEGSVNFLEKTIISEQRRVKFYWVVDFVSVSSKVRIYCGHGDTDKSTLKDEHREDRNHFFDGTACPSLWA